MDVVAMLVEKVKEREQEGWLPHNENAFVMATAPSGSNYPPELHDTVNISAATMLYLLSENRLVPGETEYTQIENLRPYWELVRAAWQEGRNMRSVRLLATLLDEVKNNMPYYLPNADVNAHVQYARDAAYQLGIGNDWPELVPPPLKPQQQSRPSALEAFPYFSVQSGTRQNNWQFMQNQARYK